MHHRAALSLAVLASLYILNGCAPAPPPSAGPLTIPVFGPDLKPESADAKTAFPVGPIDFKAVRFEEALKFLSAAAQVPIQPNWPAMEQLGIHRELPVSLKMDRAPLADILERLLVDAAGREETLDWAPRAGCVVVSAKHELAAQMFVQIYDVRQLMAAMPEVSSDELLSVLRGAVSPGSWAPFGDATVLFMSDLLVIKHDAAGHRDMRRFLDTLAAALSGRPRGASVPDDIIGIRRLATDRRALERLRKEGFVITGEALPMIEQFYDPDHLSGLPPLITCDAMLHAANMVYSHTLKQFETAQARHQADWTAALWKRLAAAKTELLDDAELTHLRGLVAVSMKLLDPEWRPEEKVALPAWVNAETAAAIEATAYEESPAWLRRVAYSVYKPRGFYAGDADLERMFRARMWWTHAPLRLAIRPDRPIPFKPDVELRMAAVLASLVEPNRQAYRRLDDPYSHLLGRPEDPDLSDLLRIAREQVGGGEPISRNRLPAVADALRKQFKPKIRVGDETDDLLEPGDAYGVYVFPGRYLFDSEVFTLTTVRPRLVNRLPCGLDLMAALGSELAGKLLIADTRPDLRSDLSAQLNKARQAHKSLDKATAATAQRDRVLQALLNPKVTEQHPAFMRSASYPLKSLQTALAGWAECRHRWQLHAKISSGGLFGGDDDFVFRKPIGFVEPNLEFWDELIEFAGLAREPIVKLVPEADEQWQVLLTALKTCRQIARLQLAGQPLPREYEMFFSGLTHMLTALFGSADEQRQDPVIAFIHRGEDGSSVSVGTGYPRAIYAVMNHKGLAWLCKGAVMTYYERTVEKGSVLTDAEWREQLQQSPPSPPWWLGGLDMPAPDTGNLEAPLRGPF